MIGFLKLINVLVAIGFVATAILIVWVIEGE